MRRGSPVFAPEDQCSRVPRKFVALRALGRDGWRGLRRHRGSVEHWHRTRSC